MKTLARSWLNGLVAAGLLLATTSCAQDSVDSTLSSPAMSTPLATGSGLSDDHKSLGVVALGPDQFLYHDWFEFEPAFKEHFARAPAYTTVRSKVLKHTSVELGDAFDEAVEAHFSSLVNAGEGAAFGLVLAPAFITVGTLSRAAFGRLEWVQPRPVVQPLEDIDGLGGSISTELLGKHGLALAIRDQVVRSDQKRSARKFVEVSFAQAREPSLWTTQADALLTVRVQSIDLIADDGDDTQVALFIHVWTNVNRSASFPIEYMSRKIALSVLTAGGALRLREEIDVAVEEIATRILDALYLAAARR